MATGILIALTILVLGFVFSLSEVDKEPTLNVAVLLSALVLLLTLVTTATPKSDTEQLKELQKYCISIGVATMTPVVMATEFKLVASATTEIKGEAE